MTRFKTCSTAILITTLAGHLCLFAAPARSGATTAQRPNILIYIPDDMSWAHTSIGGDPAVKTPSFDQLAKSGVLFTHAFCSSPSCTPSRGALLTG
jgi:N-sulfoglucosamine sulfohydrolase